MPGATRVLRHDSELGRWELFVHAPDPRLRAFVGSYEGYVETGSPAPVLRQETPTTRLPLIVNFGSSWTVAESEDGSRSAYDSFAAGIGERSVYVAASGPARCLQVDFTPLGAHLFFGLPMHELTNRVVPLDDVLPPGAHALVERLEDAPTWDERFALLDVILLSRFAQATTPSRDVAWAWNVLVRTEGRAPIGWICDRLGRSRRHLVALFREQIGVPPKTAARIMRFERAVALLERGEHGLAELAFACGYYDQAHLNRDFREFTGTSPAAFARRIVPDGGVVL
jgi:AraC-like DNA-binding protein